MKKIVDDKTFGLKNKNKSKKVQQFIHNVEATASHMGKSTKQVKMEEAARKAKLEEKKLREEAKKEQAALFKTVIPETKVPVGVDPKSVLCEFFKAGKSDRNTTTLAPRLDPQTTYPHPGMCSSSCSLLFFFPFSSLCVRCQKGDRCRFSHNMQVSLKSAKIDLYSDPRELAKDTIDSWDTEKLSEVVNKKAAGRMPPTDIVCKFFLDAIENRQYGWLWECENGPSCHYRHALPPGFVLKPKVKPGERQDEDDDETPDIGELIEDERRKLNLAKCTPITLELFTKWKEAKRKQREEAVEKERKEAAKKGGGSGLHALSGRDLFRYDPSLFQDDEEADDEQYVIESDGDEEDDEKERPLYDRDAQDEEDDGEEEDDDEHEGDGEQEEEMKEGEERKQKGAADVSSVAAAIDKNLFLDDDVPDDDDDDEEKD